MEYSIAKSTQGSHPSLAFSVLRSPLCPSTHLSAHVMGSVHRDVGRTAAGPEVDQKCLPEDLTGSFPLWASHAFSRKAMLMLPLPQKVGTLQGPGDDLHGV